MFFVLLKMGKQLKVDVYPLSIPAGSLRSVSQLKLHDNVPKTVTKQRDRKYTFANYVLSRAVGLPHPLSFPYFLN